MSKPSILLFTDWYEPGYKAGGPIRSCVNFAQQMKQDYKIFVFTGDKDAGDTTIYEGIKVDEWQEREGVAVFYASSKNISWRVIKSHIKQLDPDYIYLNSMYSKHFTIYPLMLKHLGKIRSKIILAPRGMLKESAINFKPTKKKLFLYILKKLGIHKKISFHATDIQEVNDVKKYFGEEEDIKLLSNFGSQISTLRGIEKVTGVCRIVFIGRVHPIKNLDFLLTCLQGVKDSVHLSIAGPEEDTDYLQTCKEIVKSLSSHIEITFCGTVSNKQIPDLLQSHHLFVLPTHGENFGHAIFEAFAAGRPVLISDQTPWRNLEKEKAGWDIPLDQPAQFRKTIEKLAAMDNKEYQQWSDGAWTFAKKFLENADLKNKYKALFSA